jgi:hypothetical protein
MRPYEAKFPYLYTCRFMLSLKEEEVFCSNPIAKMHLRGPPFRPVFVITGQHLQLFTYKLLEELLSSLLYSTLPQLLPFIFA